MFRRFLDKEKQAPAELPHCRRLLYAIGDIHGRCDLLDPLIEKVFHDIACSDSFNQLPIIVFLGDYIDRGLSSRSVVDTILRLQERKDVEVIALKGNHEQALMLFLDDAKFGQTWLTHGGGPTLSSYGVSPPAPRADAGVFEAARLEFKCALGPAHIGFYKGLASYFIQDDYVFVHAGVRWGVPIVDQVDEDLLWIRQDFLNSDARASHVVVHGHTPVETVYFGLNRIGLDTGAYATGVLSALRLAGVDRRVIQCR